MTINNIQVHQSGTENAETGWKTVIEESKTFELLALRGIEEVLGSTEIESGHYTQIRLDVESVTVIIDGDIREAEVPSGKIKLISSFDVGDGDTTVVTLDIDAEESVIVTGNGQVKFKPTIKILVGGLEKQSENQNNESPRKGKKNEGPQEANLNNNSSSRKGSAS